MAEKPTISMSPCQSGKSTGLSQSTERKCGRSSLVRKVTEQSSLVICK